MIGGRSTVLGLGDGRGQYNSQSEWGQQFLKGKEGIG